VEVALYEGVLVDDFAAIDLGKVERRGIGAGLADRAAGCQDRGGRQMENIVMPGGECAAELGWEGVARVVVDQEAG
jgi:hypothetical protein